MSVQFVISQVVEDVTSKVIEVYRGSIVYNKTGPVSPVQSMWQVLVLDGIGAGKRLRD